MFSVEHDAEQPGQVKVYSAKERSRRFNYQQPKAPVLKALYLVLCTVSVETVVDLLRRAKRTL